MTSKPLIGAGTLQELPKILRSLGDYQPVIIADKNVSKLHGSRVLKVLRGGADVLAIPSGETSKSLHRAEFLYLELTRRKARRNTPLIALGGGVITDLVGFVASTYMRGVPLILIPTTLLAQADAAIGGKTGVNLSTGKNLVGTFYPATATLVDFDFLKTLPMREFRNGFAEIIKMCILEGEKAFRDLEKFALDGFDFENPLFRSLLERSISAKLAVVADDPKETSGKRSILNLGHTFAHGLEAATEYKAYTHGEAVAIGLVAACRLAESAAGFSPRLTERIQSAILAFGLPVRSRKTTPEKVFSAMAQDKKRTKTLRFVLPLKLGKVELKENIPDTLVMNVLKGLS